ncbi:hypothetical protein SODALDRAFT_60311 [Sodiomyces alkalinus F11]|uniref:Uncharacterized protein n=1 Tax=Sodiomyces alkalinus (strain CBS 110278 / VKM F-3762 / F11) TaxID=1314773 RepID=A0A3N2PLI3_SODAK|nr:hypothetical protein SODALDRAFT_60311 [Sodiomyces alkalinus F11]ROT35270.1 hypothetical protein SODALDRAFT_60311 [Sodiomyces alkalinus F11]
MRWFHLVGGRSSVPGFTHFCLCPACCPVFPATLRIWLAWGGNIEPFAKVGQVLGEVRVGMTFGREGSFFPSFFFYTLSYILFLSFFSFTCSPSLFCFPVRPLTGNFKEPPRLTGAILGGVHPGPLHGSWCEHEPIGTSATPLPVQGPWSWLWVEYNVRRRRNRSSDRDGRLREGFMLSCSLPFSHSPYHSIPTLYTLRTKYT